MDFVFKICSEMEKETKMLTFFIMNNRLTLSLKELNFSLFFNHIGFQKFKNEMKRAKMLLKDIRKRKTC